ncbi:MAG TPA: hypothetical protein VFO16_03665 [Pseudonocardiaceae bacterium]|nr:hypothetical protein [Pseudonocardiaceae bacterium]
MRVPRDAAVRLPVSGPLAGAGPVLVRGNPRAVPRGWGAEPTPDAATTPMPLAAPRHATAEEKVNA